MRATHAYTLKAARRRASSFHLCSPQCRAGDSEYAKSASRYGPTTLHRVALSHHGAPGSCHDRSCGGVKRQVGSGHARSCGRAPAHGCPLILASGTGPSSADENASTRSSVSDVTSSSRRGLHDPQQRLCLAEGGRRARLALIPNRFKPWLPPATRSEAVGCAARVGLRRWPSE